MARPFHHRTVLLDAVAEHLLAAPSRVGRDGHFLDGTLGGGGHAAALLEGSSPDGTVIGIDRDPAALAAAAERVAIYGARFSCRRGSFADMERLVGDQGPFDGIVLDLGVSSPQLDQGERGFSLQQDGPVDMRMDPDQPRSAADLLDEISESDLADILFHYGEEPRARRIARALVTGGPWQSTLQLARAVEQASGYRGSRIHPATRTFQALRIAVNDELGQLERGLPAALRLLRPGGRLAVISFHSLEDRLVKRRFHAWSGRSGPKDAYGNPLEPVLGRLVVPGGIAGESADPDNPRARSARLRIFERIAETLPPSLSLPVSGSPPAGTRS